VPQSLLLFNTFFYHYTFPDFPFISIGIGDIHTLFFFHEVYRKRPCGKESTELWKTQQQEKKEEILTKKMNRSPDERYT
jgi:hypothetical protein